MKTKLRNNSPWIVLLLAPLTYAQPVINPGGVTNGASFINSTLPGGALAQGSIFSIKGENLGPGRADDYRTGTTAAALPFQTTLGGVQVTVTGSGRTVNAYIQFAWTSQINAVLPSNAPTGAVQVRVIYNNQTSQPASARVVANAVGIFSIAGGRGPGIVQNYVAAGNTPLNNAGTPLRRGSVGIIWATGLGPVSIADNIAPAGAAITGLNLANVQVLIGARPAALIGASRSGEFPGLDQIAFTVPNDAPEGCYVPLQVRIGDNYSNFVSIAIGSGARCTDAQNPLSSLNLSGGKYGSVVLARFDASLGELGNLKLDVGTASFDQVPALGDFSYNQFGSLPPLGACTVFPSDDAATDVLTGDGTDLYTGTPLDAGDAITVTGPLGTRRLEKPDATTIGSYFSLIGSNPPLPLPGFPSQALFLEGGAYTVSGPGGRDVGAFSANLTLGTPLNWTNRDTTTSVNRANGVTLNWTGGAANQTAIIVGSSTLNDGSASAVFICFAPANAGTFNVPASITSQLPQSGSADELGGVLGIVALPTGQVPTFSARGIDQGTIINLSASIKALEYR